MAGRSLPYIGVHEVGVGGGGGGGASRRRPASPKGTLRSSFYEGRRSSRVGAPLWHHD